MTALPLTYMFWKKTSQTYKNGLTSVLSRRVAISITCYELNKTLEYIVPCGFVSPVYVNYFFSYRHLLSTVFFCDALYKMVYV